MPWYLSELGRQDTPDWNFEDGQNLPRSMSNPKSIPDPSAWPIRVRLQEPTRTIPDYTVGPVLGVVVVSNTFKRMVEAWDPVAHTFVPMEIRQPDGTLWDGEDRFIFKLAGFVEGGIVVEKSEVAISYYKGEVSHYNTTRLDPRLMWNPDAIRGRHIWADANLKHMNTISDQFCEELKKRKIGSFLAVEGRIDG